MSRLITFKTFFTFMLVLNVLVILSCQMMSHDSPRILCIELVDIEMFEITSYLTHTAASDNLEHRRLIALVDIFKGTKSLISVV